MAEQPNHSYLSIGEVLGLLLEEFPDVTISKIRFLESQGLIDPERTPAGYRKFYEADIDLLRVILREQKQNFLPLRVIKDRLDSGQIDPSGEIANPTTAAPVVTETEVSAGGRAEQLDLVVVAAPQVDAPATEIPVDEIPVTEIAVDESPVAETASPAAGSAKKGVRRERGDLLAIEDLCERTGLSAAQVDELTAFGLLSPIVRGGSPHFDDSCSEVAELCARLMRSGVEPRHLKGWRTAAERETSLFEQLIAPRLRQRSPTARSEALDELGALVQVGEELHRALVGGIVRRQFDH